MTQPNRRNIGAKLAHLDFNTDDQSQEIPTVRTEQYDVTPTLEEVESIASLLEGEHGAFAAEVAEFFATQHSMGGDAGRSWAWAGVADRIRNREQKRITSARGW